jgi:hypothetical protein
MIQRNLLTWWPNFNSRIRTLTDSPHVSRYRSCLLVGLAYRDNNFRLVNGSIATREGKGGSQLRRLIASWSVCFGRAVNMVAWEVNEDQALSCQTLGASNFGGPRAVAQLAPAHQRAWRRIEAAATPSRFEYTNDEDGGHTVIRVTEEFSTLPYHPYVHAICCSHLPIWSLPCSTITLASKWICDYVRFNPFFFGFF